MKPSRRNRANAAARDEKRQSGPPKVSRYAAKFAKPAPPVPPVTLRNRWPKGPGGRR